MDDFLFDLERLQSALASENDDRNKTLTLLSEQYANVNALDVMSQLTELAYSTDYHISIPSSLKKPDALYITIVKLQDGCYDCCEKAPSNLRYVPSKDGDLLNFVKQAADRNELVDFAKGINDICDTLTVNKNLAKPKGNIER